MAKALIVAAFDLGTTFSGYAFSFRDKPLEIKHNPCWVAGSERLMSLKTPTCVLLKPNKQFHSFGFEAENKYSELAEDDKHRGWYMFRRFKMMLFDTKNLHTGTTIEDISGKKMPALDIFGYSIQYLNNHFLKTLDDQTIGIKPSDILYVITVPAIWDHKAKQFMRKAANMGGIKDDQLRLALEPEAAAIWCQVATDHKLSGLADNGSKYMVVDLGGGTADISVLETKADGTLKELSKASGGPWGGNKVNEAYEEMLSNIFGAQAIQKFKKTYLGDYLDLLRDFETVKRTISIDTEGKMMFRIPASLKKSSETRKLTMKDLIDKSKYREQISWMGDKIRVEKVVARSLFDEAIGELTSHVELLLSDPQVTSINAILLVGGFGECGLIKDSFENKFRNKKLIVPADAGLAVLKGSVRFGHLPGIISLRVSRYTFGWSVMPEFDEKIHDKSKKVTHYGKQRCRDVFRAIVQIGEEVPVGKEIRENGRPASGDQRSFTIEMYSSTEEQPKYVTDNGCTYLGQITVDLPDSNNIAEKHFSVFLTFGSTELKVRVLLEKTNRTYETYVKYFD